jgi:hypothetical protein
VAFQSGIVTGSSLESDLAGWNNQNFQKCTFSYAEPSMAVLHSVYNFARSSIGRHSGLAGNSVSEIEPGRRTKLKSALKLRRRHSKIASARFPMQL